MYQSVSFNIYEEHLEKIVFGKSETEDKPKNREGKKLSDIEKPIPKPLGDFPQTPIIQIDQN